MNDMIYLGDAVYAHFDGYGIETQAQRPPKRVRGVSRARGAPRLDGSFTNGVHNLRITDGQRPQSSSSPQTSQTV